ncbi:hypothetical protein AAL_02375 [Moelleriella libera RCEF 2490]|uniref:Rhodopsin domain-containing protein n=1 Tax=Moelleriella libera RCEF 2490 TaxID=1081109 RepID=A0A168EI71_9HYPO|nr:hypothetical protein AAL_02375 [Moelleriella libera RCEF 2490]
MMESSVSPSAAAAHHQSLASAPLPPPSPTFTPSLPPPPGVTSNPDNPASLSGLANLTIAVSVPIVTIFFLLRVYARIFVKRTWIAEDVLVTISWAGAVAYCGIMRATMSHHGGEHGWDITKEQAHEAAYWFNVASIEYGVMIGITKLAVLCLYRRVFSPTRWSGFDKICVGLIVIVAGFYSSTSIAKIWECSPREKIWNNAIPGTCLNLQLILNVSGAFNMVTDYLILLIPVQAVRKLRLDRTRRLLIIMAFTFGLCAPIFATVGFIVRLRNSGNPDNTWKQPEILLWGAGELVSGNLCVCFPELAVLFRSREARERFLKNSGGAGGAGRSPGQPATTITSLVGTAVYGNNNNNSDDNDDRSYIELRNHEHVGARSPPAKNHIEV